MAIILAKDTDSGKEKIITDEEYRQLLKGHIPIFYIENENLLNDKRDIIIYNFYDKENRFINFDYSVDYSTLVKEYLLNKYPDTLYFEHFFHSLKEKIIIEDSNFIKNIIADYYNTFLNYTHEKLPVFTNLYNNLDSFKISDKISQNLGILFPGLLNGSDGLAIAFINTYHKNHNLYVVAQDIICYNFTQINLSNKINFSIFQFPLSSICSKLTLVRHTENITLQIVELLLKHIENLENEINYSFIDGISGTILFLINNRNYFDTNQFVKLIKVLTERLKNDIESVNGEVKVKDVKIEGNQYWNLSEDKLGIMIILNNMQENNILTSKTLINIFDSMERTLFDYWNKNKTTLLKTTSWSLGKNGVIAYILSSKNQLKKHNLIELHKTIVDELYTQNFSLSSGTLGNIYIKNFINKNFNINEKNEVLFKDVFGLNDSDLFKRMLSKGLYEGLAGFLVIDNTLEVIIPNGNWMKI
jgi:hypothetical protein